MASVFTPEGSRFVKMHERWMGICARVSGMMVVAIAVATLADVIGRATQWYIIIGTYEISQLLMVWLGFIGVAYAHSKGSNIRVDLITNRLSPKGQDIILVISLLIGIFAFGNIFYANLGFVYDSIITHEVIAGIPRPTPLWPAKFAVPFGTLFLLIEFILEIGRATSRIRGGKY